MKKQDVDVSGIKLVGISVRTNNESEMNEATAKIGLTVGRYFQEGLSEKILCRVKPGTTYSVYTDYESDMEGDYTFFIGEAVSSFDDLSEGLSTATVSAGKYAKFTNGPGVMPKVCIDLWQQIWQMAPEELGGQRLYHTDFEIYDERAQDPKNTELDIYIGIAP